MGLFHTHHFVEQSRTFVPPADLKRASGCGEELFLKLTSGFTSIVSRCVSCGEMSTTTALGQHNRPGSGIASHGVVAR